MAGQTYRERRAALLRPPDSPHMVLTGCPNPTMFYIRRSPSSQDGVKREAGLNPALRFCSGVRGYPASPKTCRPGNLAALRLAGWQAPHLVAKPPFARIWSLFRGQEVVLLHFIAKLIPPLHNGTLTLSVVSYVC